jgi:2-methylcitrate dehydratase PrpD
MLTQTLAAWIAELRPDDVPADARREVALRPARARERGWHLTSVCGPLGAATAAAMLLRLDTQRTAWALGLAGSAATDTGPARR